MKKILKYVAAVALLFLGLGAFAQEKTEAYYITHESEILPDAQVAFREGDYDRTVELCRLHFIIVGDNRADALRDKARECAKLTIEMNAFASADQRDLAREKAQAILALNSDDKKAQELKDAVDRLVLRKKVLFLPEEEMETLKWELFSNKVYAIDDIKWTSSSPDVATVDSYGTVTAHRTGEATITATLGEMSASCLVTVVNMQLAQRNIQFYIGERRTLSLNAPIDGIEWLIRDPDIVSMAVVGNKVELEAKQVGNTEIIALRGGHRVSCKIEVDTEQMTAVDMGLPSGTMWASRNAGASFRTDEGSSFNHRTVTTSTFNPFSDTDWSMPSVFDFKELMAYCHWTSTANGITFISNVNGNSVYFPFVGPSWGVYWVKEGHSYSEVEMESGMSELLCYSSAGSDEYPVRFVSRNDVADDDMIMIIEDDNTGVEIMEEEVVGEEVEEEAIPFQLVEQKPSFNGGDMNEFSKWVNSQLVYPEIAKENGVQGRVTLQFTVEANGRVRHVKILRGVDASLDKEAVRVVSMSPRWEPAQHLGQKIRVSFTFSIDFQLK